MTEFGPDWVGEHFPDAPAGEPRDPLPDEPLTELGMARRLLGVYGAHLRYVPAWRRWLVWDGRRWAPDASGQAPRWQKTIARRVMSDALLIDDDQARRAAVALCRRAESAAGVAGALTLAGTEAGTAITPEQLDADPWLLNCANGTLDLRTGTLDPHDPAHHLTKMTAAAYDPDATGDEFPRFLEQIQPDKAMRAFLARLLGHALVGKVLEHLLPILCGTGANGKSTLVGAVLGALGDYGAAADPQLFTVRGFEAHPTGVADLFGRRLVVVHETDAGGRLDEGKVKRLTGGDQIKARRMREDFWAFTPSHTALMLTNHRPDVRGSDEGIWRRLRLVPFDVVIKPEDQDLELGDRLALEQDAVLAWLVAGFADWRQHGLAEPERVAEATAEYRDSADAVGRFIADCCVLGEKLIARSSDLWAAWQAWCLAEGVDLGTQTALGLELTARGFASDRTNAWRGWRGLGLLAAPSPGGAP
jgi:putative DNA primase/helicase